MRRILETLGQRILGGALWHTFNGTYLSRDVLAQRVRSEGQPVKQQTTFTCSIRSTEILLIESRVLSLSIDGGFSGAPKIDTTNDTGFRKTPEFEVNAFRFGQAGRRRAGLDAERQSAARQFAATRSAMSGSIG